MIRATTKYFELLKKNLNIFATMGMYLSLQLMISLLELISLRRLARLRHIFSQISVIDFCIDVMMYDTGLGPGIFTILRDIHVSSYFQRMNMDESI